MVWPALYDGGDNSLINTSPKPELHAFCHQQGGDTSTRARERLKRAVLEEAHIVACTLSFAGSAQFQVPTQ